MYLSKPCAKFKKPVTKDDLYEMPRIDNAKRQKVDLYLCRGRRGWEVEGREGRMVRVC